MNGKRGKEGRGGRGGDELTRTDIKSKGEAVPRHEPGTHSEFTFIFECTCKSPTYKVVQKFFSMGVCFFYPLETIVEA